MKAERVVVDTNVLISAALSSDTAPAQAVKQVLARHRLVFSRETFEELETRLWRPKFDRHLSQETRRLLLHDFNAVAEWVTLPSGTLPAWRRDPDDDKFIHTALESGSRWLISGDRDLLDLSEIQRVQILSPAQALQELGQHQANASPDAG